MEREGSSASASAPATSAAADPMGVTGTALHTQEARRTVSRAVQQTGRSPAFSRKSAERAAPSVALGARPSPFAEEPGAAQSVVAVTDLPSAGMTNKTED